MLPFSQPSTLNLFSLLPQMVTKEGGFCFQGFRELERKGVSYKKSIVTIELDVE